MKRNVRVYLQDMHDSMLKALEYTEGLDYEAFAGGIRQLEIAICDIKFWLG